MGAELRRWTNRKEARKTLQRLFDHSDSVLVVHYSCEGFAKSKDGRTSRIASIAVKHLKSGTVRSFSINHHAEQLQIPADQIWDDFSRIELSMLTAYFQYVWQNASYTWAHWNMRSDNYGFQALEHRFKVLGGEPVAVEDARKVDIAQLMKDIYGPNYVGEGVPVLVTLCELNSIRSSRFMPGELEAEAFERGEFLRLQQSTHKKVDFISYIAGLAVDKRLKTHAKWHDTFGLNIAVLVEFIREHWVYGLLGIIALGYSLYRVGRFLWSLWNGEAST